MGEPSFGSEQNCAGGHAQQLAERIELTQCQRLLTLFNPCQMIAVQHPSTRLPAEIRSDTNLSQDLSNCFQIIHLPPRRKREDKAIF
ncbi:hypothetical protein PSCICO_17410 [Pseudomonas cichorii]|nr:hypothetical protein PSCICO_17410 [Pseudomonas cichorii]